jgi:hypothetical protein
MSAQEIAGRLTEQVARREYKVAHPEALPYLFDGFVTELLLKADDLANRKVTGICARAAIDAAGHRAHKISGSGGRIVFLSDFVPAFEYISDLSIPKNRFRFPSEDVAVFSAEVSQLIRQCCPWC